MLRFVGVAAALSTAALASCFLSGSGTGEDVTSSGPAASGAGAASSATVSATASTAAKASSASTGGAGGAAMSSSRATGGASSSAATSSASSAASTSSNVTASSGATSASSSTGSNGGCSPGNGEVCCPTTICSNQKCCVDSSGDLDCKPGSSCGSDYSVTCDDSSECPGSQVCCVPLDNMQVSGDVACVDTCDDGDFVLCLLASPTCPNGLTCQDPNGNGDGIHGGCFF